MHGKLSNSYQVFGNSFRSLFVCTDKYCFRSCQYTLCDTHHAEEIKSEYDKIAHLLTLEQFKRDIVIDTVSCGIFLTWRHFFYVKLQLLLEFFTEIIIIITKNLPQIHFYVGYSKLFIDFVGVFPLMWEG